MFELPEDILIQIFMHLDNDSMFNVLQSCYHFSNVFSTSSKLLLKFNLHISPQNIDQISTNTLISNIPFRNITISNIKSQDDFPKLLKILESFSNFVEILHLKNVKNFEKIAQSFVMFENLREFKLEECSAADITVTPLPLFSTLKSLEFYECSSNIFNLFTLQSSVEKLKFYKNKIDNTRYSFDNFKLMTAAMPNLNHVIINGFASSSFFNEENFTFKVKIFGATLLTGWWSVTESRLNFLKSQKGTLQELLIHRLPYDDDGDEVLKFIIEEMNLKKFYLRKTALILDGVKQDVTKLTVGEYEICSLYEMLLHFPIQFLKLNLTHTHIDEPAVNQIINPETNLFDNLKSLEVVDGSKELYNFPRFLGLYKNCRHIEKLAITTNDDNINFVLIQCLPEMTKLNEIRLNVNVKKSLVKEMFKNVKKYVKNLEKIEVLGKFEDDAKECFKDKIQIDLIL